MGRWRRTWWAVAVVGCAAPAPIAPPPRATQTRSESVSFCASVIVEHDQPRCLGELTPEQQRHRAESVRLLVRGGRVVRRDAVSGSGAPLLTESSAVYELRGGRVVGWTEENKSGVRLGRQLLSDDAKWVRWLDEQDRPRVMVGTKISGVRRRLDERGRVVAYAWVDALGSPVAKGDVWETRVRHAPHGAPRETSFFGASGGPVLGAEGAHRVTYQLDAHGRPVEQRYFDAQGRPVRAAGAHVVRTSYDAFGNPASASYFDEDARPALSDAEGAARVGYRRDERGNEVSRERWDPQGQLRAGPGGWAVRLQRYDEQDRVVETSYLGAQREPVRDTARGAARIRQDYDERGNVLRERLFDEQGAPTVGAEGYHQLDTEYDQRDNPTRHRYTDASGAPGLRGTNVAVQRRIYDGDRLIRVEYLGTGEELVLAPGGYAAYEVTYAEDGSEGIKRYFAGASAEPMSCEGSLSPALQSELAERASTLRACYERLLRFGSKLEGKLVLELKVATSGQVLSTQVAEDDLKDGQLASCVVRRMREPYLAKPEGQDCVTVRVPVNFRRPRE